MTDAEAVKVLREAILRADCCAGASGLLGMGGRPHFRDCPLVAALAATAEPVKPEAQGPHSASQCCVFPCPAHEPSPAPRDAEREALKSLLEQAWDAGYEWATSAVDAADGGYADAKERDLTALLPVKQP